jgi:regulator of sirC expression with transglutaminase-like and TPR domain
MLNELATSVEENREISALFHLIDDPDEEVYSTVSSRIISFGKEIIPNLESLWELSSSEDVQERIETIIHKLHYRDLIADFTNWKNDGCELLSGALLTARYHYPEMKDSQAKQEIEKLRRNIWLELNNYLTPLEQVNVITSILYNYYKQKGVEISYTQPEDFLITKTLETKKGNAISNGILYLVLCNMLDIPVKATNIPRQFILGYFDPQYKFLKSAGSVPEKISFFIDPLNGNIYSHKDVESYFKRISIAPAPVHFRQLNNKRIIRFLLEELSKCFDNERNRYKRDELLSLARLLDE